MNQYICLKLDVVGSRNQKYKPWVDQLIDQLNQTEIQFVIVPTRRAGDEVFMVLNNMKLAWTCIRVIYRHVRRTNQSIYLGIGRGEVSSEEHSSEEIEGTAIWRASDALSELKEKPSNEVLEEIAKSSFHYNIKVSDQNRCNDYHRLVLYGILSKMERRTKLQQDASDFKFFFPNQSNKWYAERLFQGQGSANAEVNFSKHLIRGDHKLLAEMERNLIAYFDREEIL